MRDEPRVERDAHLMTRRPHRGSELRRLRPSAPIYDYIAPRPRACALGVEACVGPHPAGTETAARTALSLAHECFAGKRASGPRPRRVARRSRYRPKRPPAAVEQTRLLRKGLRAPGWPVFALSRWTTSRSGTFASAETTAHIVEAAAGATAVISSSGAVERASGGDYGLGRSTRSSLVETLAFAGTGAPSKRPSCQSRSLERPVNLFRVGQAPALWPDCPLHAQGKALPGRVFPGRVPPLL